MQKMMIRSTYAQQVAQNDAYLICGRDGKPVRMCIEKSIVLIVRDDRNRFAFFLPHWMINLPYERLKDCHACGTDNRCIA